MCVGSDYLSVPWGSLVYGMVSYFPLMVRVFSSGSTLLTLELTSELPRWRHLSCPRSRLRDETRRR
jgi:hypothetical protein